MLYINKDSYVLIIKNMLIHVSQPIKSILKLEVLKYKIKKDKKTTMKHNNSKQFYKTLYFWTVFRLPFFNNFFEVI